MSLVNVFTYYPSPRMCDINIRPCQGMKEKLPINLILEHVVMTGNVSSNRLRSVQYDECTGNSFRIRVATPALH